MENINRILADKLVYYRKQHHMTQEELAEHLGVTFQAVSKWETARSAPDLTFLPMLAELFGCSIDELFGRTHDITAVVKSDLPWDNDDIYHAALFKGHELIKDGEALRKFTFIIDAEIEHLTVHGNADIHGSVTEGCTIGNNLKIAGIIVGDCQVGNNATVEGNITGDCSAGNNLDVGGDVVSDHILSAGNNLTVWHGNITGDCTAGNNIDAHNCITGDCTAQHAIITKEICAETINSNGAITVSGNATLKGEAHCHILECGSISEGTIVIEKE